MAENMIEDVTGVVERLGYECVNAAVKTDSARLRLQVLIDSIGGIGTDDCERVSRSLNTFLDEHDYPELTDGYYLEVSSPGLERPLFTPEHYRRFTGQEVRVSLREPVEGRKSVTGVLSAAEGGVISIFAADEDRDISIPFDCIKSGNLVFRGFEPKAPQKKRSGASRRIKN